MTVEEARRYSRTTGLSWCDSVTGTPGRRSASSSPTRSSWAGLTVAHSRQTPIASTSCRSQASIASSTDCSSSCVKTAPSESTRSASSKVSQRGTYGGGYSIGVKGPILPPSRSSSVSGKPAVVRKAVRAVFPSTIAFVERVVPYAKRDVRPSSSATLSPSSSPSCSRLGRMPSKPRATVVSDLATCRSPRGRRAPRR